MSSISNTINPIISISGSIIFICGTFGNLLNIRLFWKTRRNPCGFIFLFTAFNNCIILFTGLFLRVLNSGLQIDLSKNNRIWCKIRAALMPSTILISLTCMCLASTDRFFASCRQEKYRKYSRLSVTISVIIVISIVAFCNFTPYLIYADLIKNPNTGVTSCALISNQLYDTYLIYFALPFYYGLAPSLILTITGYLTYRNTNKLQIIRHRQLAQRQLTSMTLILIPIILLTTIPYVLFSEYTLLTATRIKSANRRDVELSVSNIITSLSYIPYACPFFTFVISSRTFRQEAKSLILHCNPNFLNVNQIQPKPEGQARNIELKLIKTNENIKSAQNTIINQQ